jgi:hypothetical protein
MAEKLNTEVREFCWFSLARLYDFSSVLLYKEKILPIKHDQFSEMIYDGN